MWIVFGVIGVTVGWVLMMVAIWTVLYDHGSPSDGPESATHH